MLFSEFRIQDQLPKEMISKTRLNHEQRSRGREKETSPAKLQKGSRALRSSKSG
jgi:hypothetical protein